jgi:replication factor C subunit 3/5
MGRPSKKVTNDDTVPIVKRRTTKSKIIEHDVVELSSAPTFPSNPPRNIKIKSGGSGSSQVTYMFHEGVTFDYSAHPHMVKVDMTRQPTISFFKSGGDTKGCCSSSDTKGCCSSSDTKGCCDDRSSSNSYDYKKEKEGGMCHTTPWVEKYRPSNFEDIVLDPLNKVILNNILEMNYFPNLLLYGPPGTGKTTTIINLVNAYQEKFKLKNKGLMIHLNASDDRGIDIIRNQINSFVSSKSLFGDGIKFVILDEVDYMTKNAQTALRYLLNSYNNNNVRFCLICNYVSRIDESLQSEFVRMRFNQLPEPDIISFLRRINDSERLMLTDDTLISIQRQFNSDIRSMINYMQTNQDIIQNCNIVKDDIWVQLLEMVKSPSTTKSDIISYINTISRTYNIERKNLIKNYLNFIIRKRPECIVPGFLSNIENIMHLPDGNTEYIINYIVLQMMQLFRPTKSAHSYGEM